MNISINTRAASACERKQSYKSFSRIQLSMRERRVKGERDKGNLFVVAVIVLSFAVTLGLSFIFSGKGFLSLAGVFDKESTRSFYAVAVGGYGDMTLARNSAELIKSRGGAGYVRSETKDGIENIEIIFAVYKDKTPAEKVLETLGDHTAYIKEITVKESSYSWCEGDLKQAVKEAMTYFDLTFDKLFEVSNSLNDNTLSVGDAKTQIRVLYTHIEDIKSAFYQNTQKETKPQITEIKLALITALALLDGIEYGSVASTCSSIRYALVQVVFCYQSLMTTV